MPLELHSCTLHESFILPSLQVNPIIIHPTLSSQLPSSICPQTHTIPGSNQMTVCKLAKMNLILFQKHQHFGCSLLCVFFTAYSASHNSHCFAESEGKHFKVNFQGICIENIIQAPYHKTAPLISVSIMKWQEAGFLNQATAKGYFGRILNLLFLTVRCVRWIYWKY